MLNKLWVFLLLSILVSAQQNLMLCNAAVRTIETPFSSRYYIQNSVQRLHMLSNRVSQGIGNHYCRFHNQINTYWNLNANTTCLNVKPGPHARLVGLRKLTTVKPVHVSTVDSSEICSIVRKWVERWVIALGLCPWARSVILDGKLKIVVVNDTVRAAKKKIVRRSTCKKIIQESKRLTNSGTTPHSTEACKPVETVLVVVPEYKSFDDFLQLSTMVEQQIESTLDLASSIQIATFHPQYQFANSSKYDVENYTNRSPYPIIHLLKVDQVSDAVSKSGGNTDFVWKRNIARLQALGIDKVKQIQNSIIYDATSS